MYSYISGPSLEPYSYRSIPEMLQHWADEYPDREAFVYYDLNLERHAITCKSLRDKANIFGRYLRYLGVQNGDIVAVCMNNSLETVIVLMGIHLAGAILTSISKNMADGSDVIDSVLEMRAPVFVADGNEIQESIITSLLEQSGDAGLKHVICTRRIHRYKKGPSVSFMGDILQNEANTTATKASLPRVDPEDIALYLRTSGSTGKPKMVAQAHMAFLSSHHHSLDKVLAISSDSIYFCDRPFGWGVGYPREFVACGAKRILLHPKLSTSGLHTDAISDVIASERCSHVYLPGYLVRDVLERPALKDKFASVEKTICSGERIPKSFAQLLDGYCKELAIWYGSTEASGVSVFMSRDPSVFEDGIIGTPQPGVEMKLVDGSGTTVPQGETGELLVRSIFRFTEYRGMPEKFAETVDNNNWLRTGDLGFIRPDGNVVLKGRTAEQISMGTMKYFPWEVENVLVRCPGVASVVAIPVPDVRLKEVVCACVKPDKVAALTMEDLQKFCDETWTDTATATGFSLKPRYLVIREDFPVNSAGKLDRKSLAREVVAELGLQA